MQDVTGSDNSARDGRPRPAIRLLGKRYHLPQSVFVRRGVGIFLVLLGLLGFLPVLGFWMIPLGLMVLSYDSHIIRRWRRRLAVRFGRLNGNGRNTENGEAR